MLILTVSSLLETTFVVTEGLITYHTLSVLGKDSLAAAASYGHPITLLTRLSVDLREILRSVHDCLMCPAANYTICRWWQTLCYTSN